jgi:hypothetical protein
MTRTMTNLEHRSTIHIEGLDVVGVVSNSEQSRDDILCVTGVHTGLATSNRLEYGSKGLNQQGTTMCYYGD